MSDEHEIIADRPDEVSVDERLRQLELQAVHGLEILGPGPAAFFQDACQLMRSHATQFCTVPHLVAHLLRETNGAILNLLAVAEDIPQKADAKARKKVLAACRLLGISTSDKRTTAWIRLSTSSEQGFHRWAHRDTLSSPRPVDEEFTKWFNDAVEVIAYIASLVEQRYLKLHDLVDQLIQRPDPPDDLASCIPRTPLVLAYLFKSLQHLSWIIPLRRAGFFNLPEDHTGVQDAEARRYSPWPQADYLARMAATQDRNVQSLVLDIMLPCGVSQAPFVHHVLSSAARAMPPGRSAKWAEREELWLRQQNEIDGSLALELGALISHLAKGGETDTALRLASALLEVLPDPETDKKREARERGDVTAIFSPEPTARLSKYEYDEILQKNIPDLAFVAPEETFGMFSVLVEKAMMYGLHDPDKKKPNDQSMVRRPAIEDHEQNHDRDFEHILINTWRDLSVSIVAKHPERLEELIRTIEVREWNIFRRLALHLLRVADKPPTELVEARLANRDYLRNYGVHHEFWNLLHDRFGQISRSGQQAILESIAVGIDLDGENDLPLERRDQYRRHDEYRWLLAIANDLGEAQKDRVKALRAEFGAPSMPPDFVTWTGKTHFVTPQSPLKQDQIAAMPVGDRVRWLKDWVPPQNRDGPTPVGLGEQLAALVQSAPEKWAGDLALFQDAALDPTYQRYLVSGFARVQEAGKPVPWEKVLSFCKWLVDQPVVIPGRELSGSLAIGFSADRDRRLTRLEVARLLGKAFQPKGVISPALSFRRSFWEIIEPLMHDADPTLEQEARQVGGTMDALTTSLNTVRGVALHDAMEYAMWVYRQSESDLKVREERRPNWTDMPEVREVLEARFDMQCGFGWSATDRAVIGQWLPQIVHVDPKWVEEHLRDLFPESADLARQRDALWDTYLCYSQLYGNVYGVIRDQYFDAVRALAKETAEADEDKPETRLAQHVMLLCMWGTEGLEQGSLVDTFFESAKPDLAGKALSFVGSTLDSKEQIPDDVIERLSGLWDWRVESVGGIGAMKEPELDAFCLWFVSGQFDMPWLLQYLPSAVGVKGMRWVEDKILQRLLAHFDEYPAQTLLCLCKMVERAQDSWTFRPSQDKPTWQILDKGLSHADPAIREEAESITHLLGSKGYLGYRELLKSHRQDSAKGEDNNPS